MNLSFLLAQQIVVMGLMIFLGFVVARVKLVTLEDSTGISKMTLYLICPCTILCSMMTSFTMDKAIGFILAIGAATVINLVYVLIGRILGKTLHLNSAEEASVVYANCGNLIIPIINYVLGADYVLYTAAFMIVQTFLIWTHGLSLISGDKQISWKKILFNPNVLAVAVGLVIFFGHITIPEIPKSAMSRIGDCIGPVSMVVVGIMLGTADLKEVFTDKRTWLVSGIRLIFCPLVIVLILWSTHATSLTSDAANVLFISFLASAAPSASTISQMANVYHSNEIQAGCINMMSVVLCMATMPVMSMFYTALCMK